MTKEELENLSNDELLSLYNDYADENYYEQIYSMDDFDEILGNMTPSDLANKIFYGDFRPNDKYFMFDGYDNLKSFDYISEEIDMDDLLKFVNEKEGQYD